MLSICISVGVCVCVCRCVRVPQGVVVQRLQLGQPHLRVINWFLSGLRLFYSLLMTDDADTSAPWMRHTTWSELHRCGGANGSHLNSTHLIHIIHIPFPKSPEGKPYESHIIADVYVYLKPILWLSFCLWLFSFVLRLTAKFNFQSGSKLCPLGI